ncbi:uncharacterized protein [Argopecten irradians]|uniref:uncharacterized protein n=1 Tax=Argopecten irradians TaxID=31199 RepID=UPI00371D6B78
MVIDVFCPDLNVQAALSFVAVMWIVSLTRVKSGDVNEYFYTPLANGLDISGCEMTIQAYPNVADGQALYITMATRYNETFTEDTNLTLDSSVMYRSSQTLSHVHRFTSDARPNMQILPDVGDPMYIPSSNQPTTSYLLLLDDASQHGEKSVYLVGMNDNTTVNVYMNTNISTNSSYEMVASMQINKYDTVLLNSTYTVDGVRINSSQIFSVVVTSGNAMNQCNFSTDFTWDRLPSTNSMGHEFNIMPPSDETVHICKFLGSSNGNLSIKSEGTSTFYDMLPYTTLRVNLTGYSEVVVSSSEPIQTSCTTWIKRDTPYDQQVYRNQYSPLPVAQMSSCNIAVVQNCENSSCILAMSESTSGNLDIRNLSEKSKTLYASIRTIMVDNRKYHIWSIGNLSDGLYVIETQDNAPLMVFVQDLSFGRFFPLETSACNTSMITQSMVVTPGSKASPTDALVTPQSLVETTSGYHNVSLQSNTSIDSTGSSITGAINSTSVTSSSSSTTPTQQVVVSKYSFVYDEISDDDRILNEYMIAVIVSLGTAIFAVVAVLSTFLLLEVLSRRRQLGNSKIRPMVS